MTPSGRSDSVIQSLGTPYDYRAKKLVAVLNDKLTSGTALNVLGHMALALGTLSPDELMGRRSLADASGIQHAGISRYPLIVTKTSSGKLRRLIDQARDLEDIRTIDFPEQMLFTGHDDELASSIAAVKEANILYLGALLYGDTASVSNLTGNFSLWKS